MEEKNLWEEEDEWKKKKIDEDGEDKCRRKG